MSFLASFLAALIPMTAYLILLWRSDRNEREPFIKVLKHFLWGAIGAIIFGFIFSYIFNFSAEILLDDEYFRSLLGAVIIAPVVEEIVKSIYLLKTYKKDYFDNLTDGLVYGAAIGLGFGMTENLLYFTLYDTSFNEWLSVVFIRSLFSSVMHAISTSIVGAFYAKMKFSRNLKNYPLVFTGLLVAVVIHSFWNLSMSFNFTFVFGILFMVVMIISYFLFFKYSIKREIRIISNELKDELNWLKLGFDERTNKLVVIEDESIAFSKLDLKEYMNFAAKLAFRKLQAKNCGELQREMYNEDIESIKSKLKRLILSNRKKEL